MKFNWGTGIVIAFALFIAFIMYMVITMSTDKKYDHDLVTDEYYKKELSFQDKLDKEQQTLNAGYDISIKKNEKGLLISFPGQINDSEITGKVFLYRPSNKQLDFEIPFSTSNHLLLIPDNRLLDGRWNIEVDWKYNDSSYLNKKEITY
ncbi:FixH family protein [Zhouia spongiae]|uniref:FixH family protein n=1 Tax=Zhouia spongiae TaxID=2202721 RepID=A0ABY3YMX2_9FLAO|nr:FixH family protein [Zhouia spongiae]UNY99181.1 FixH family protein [Zhouia spongiae]